MSSNWKREIQGIENFMKIEIEILYHMKGLLRLKTSLLPFLATNFQT